MTDIETIQSLASDPEALERAYRQALRDGTEASFTEAVEADYAGASDNLLLAAWHYRLTLGEAAGKAKGRAVAWGWALALGALNGLLLWLLSDDTRFSVQVTNPLTGRATNFIPLVALLAAPISGAMIALFLTLASHPARGTRARARWGRLLAVTAGLAACAAYVLLVFPRIWPRLFQEQYLTLMVLHLGLLAWAAVGIIALARHRAGAATVGGGAENRFAFLVRSLGAFVVAGLLALAGGLFFAITFGLFDALGIQLPTVVQRLFMAGGAGLIAVAAVALVYDPAVAPAEQAADEGLSKLVALLMRLMLPLAVGVLLVYLFFIPFNWREPFENRDVLVIFNAMLFAVVALLVGATPVHGAELGDKGQTWLRRGVIALAVLALLISLYALAAILYRTANDRLTPNRLLFIGWDGVNIAILVLLLTLQARSDRLRWLPAMHRTFAAGAVLYVAWSTVGLLAVPWLFRGDPAALAGLPSSVQQILYEHPEPILLKCHDSPHIYLLQDGQKRWIKDIPTFEAEGYRWGDVQFIRCDDLRLVPDGEAIPPGAGPPPQP
jgi:hypothetical protein